MINGGYAVQSLACGFRIAMGTGEQFDGLSVELERGCSWISSKHANGFSAIDEDFHQTTADEAVAANHQHPRFQLRGRSGNRHRATARRASVSCGGNRLA